MALSQSVLSEMLDAFRAGEGVDLIRDAVQLVLQELIDTEATEVVDAMVAEAQEHLDEHVAAGDLTTDEAAARLATITERITAFVNGNLPAGGLGSGPGFGPGRGRGHGPHDDLDGDISETDATGRPTARPAVDGDRRRGPVPRCERPGAPSRPAARPAQAATST
jgi:hypothetical protein